MSAEPLCRSRTDLRLRNSPRRIISRSTSSNSASATATQTGSSPPYEDSLTIVSPLSTPRRSDPPPLPPKASARCNLQSLPLDTGRNNAMGMMFLLCDCFEARGHASVDEEMLTHLQTMAPAVNQNPQILNTFLEWARREGNSPPTSTGCHQQSTRRP